MYVGNFTKELRFAFRMNIIENDNAIDFSGPVLRAPFGWKVEKIDGHKERDIYVDELRYVFFLLIISLVGSLVQEM